MTSRTTRRVMPDLTDKSNLVIEAVVVAHITVRRAAVASLAAVVPSVDRTRGAIGYPTRRPLRNRTL